MVFCSSLCNLILHFQIELTQPRLATETATEKGLRKLRAHTMITSKKALLPFAIPEFVIKNTLFHVTK